MMVVKCLFELPKKDVVGNFEFVYERIVIGREDATGDSGGLSPSVDRKGGSQERADFKFSESTSHGCVRRCNVVQGKGCDESGRMGGAKRLV